MMSMRVTLYEDEIRELIDLLDNQSPVSNSPLRYKMRLALDHLEPAALRMGLALSEAQKEWQTVSCPRCGLTYYSRKSLANHLRGRAHR